MNGLIISGTRELSQRELFERVQRAASGFHGLGVGDDSAVALVLRNDFAFFEAAMAAAMVGAYAVPVNWHFTAEEAGYVIADCGAKVVVVHADLLPHIVSGIPDGVTVFVVPTPPEIRVAYDVDPAHGEVPAGRTDWNTWVAGHPAWTEPPKPARGNMIYTSGTTGRPKGVRREPATPEMLQIMARMV